MTVPARVLRPGSPPRDSMIWALLTPDYPATPAASAAIEASMTPAAVCDEGTAPASAGTGETQRLPCRPGPPAGDARPI